jgi:hypothetical protein
MPFDGNKTKEILALSLGIATYGAILCLTVLAYRGWANRWRQVLPRWRSALGLTSIVVTFLTWLSLAVLALSERIGLNPSFISVDWTTPAVILVAAATPLALALRGTSRIEAIAAGLLLVVGLTAVVS